MVWGRGGRYDRCVRDMDYIVGCDRGSDMSFTVPSPKACTEIFSPSRHIWTPFPERSVGKRDSLSPPGSPLVPRFHISVGPGPPVPVTGER